jgi:hypothetical protein
MMWEWLLLYMMELDHCSLETVFFPNVCSPSQPWFMEDGKYVVRGRLYIVLYRKVVLCREVVPL